MSNTDLEIGLLSAKGINARVLQSSRARVGRITIGDINPTQLLLTTILAVVEQCYSDIIRIVATSLTGSHLAVSITLLIPVMDIPLAGEMINAIGFRIPLTKSSILTAQHIATTIRKFIMLSLPRIRNPIIVGIKKTLISLRGRAVLGLTLFHTRHLLPVHIPRTRG